MATKRITLSGKSEYCKPYPFQLDTAFIDNSKGPDPRGGNVSTGLVLDEDSKKVFAALGARAKAPDGTLKLRRYERHPVLGELGPVIVTGISTDGEEAVLIGNGSEIKCEVDAYDYTFNGRPSKGLRWVSVNVVNLVPYEKAPESKPAVGVPVV